LWPSSGRQKDDSLVHHVDELPSDIAIACLLNQLVGGMSYLYWREQPIAVTNFSRLYKFPLLGRKRLLKAEVMSNSQYDAAKTELLSRMQAMRENESGNRTLIPNSNGTGSGGEDSVDTLDDKYDLPILSEYQAAMNERIQYQRIVKKSNYFPKKLKKEGLVEIGDIRFGIVEERGEDLDASHPFKKCNLLDFIDEMGYFDLVKYFGFNQQSFPFIYKLSCCLAAIRTNEVGCERFFSIAGYVSNPRRTSLKVKHYVSDTPLAHRSLKIVDSPFTLFSD
jgi:hypothetical protein